MSTNKIRTLLKETFEEGKQNTTIQDIERVISNHGLVTIQEFHVNGEQTGESYKEVSPVAISNHYAFFATDKSGQEKEYGLSQVVKIHELEEALTVKFDMLDKIDTNKLSKVAEKTDVLLTETYLGTTNLAVGDKVRVSEFGEAPEGEVIVSGIISEVEEDENGNFIISFEGDEFSYSSEDYDITKVDLNKPIFQNLGTTQKDLVRDAFSGSKEVILNGVDNLDEAYLGKTGLTVGEEAQVYNKGEAPSGVMVDFGTVEVVEEDEKGDMCISFEPINEDDGNQWYSEGDYDIVRVSLDEPLMQKLYPAQKTLPYTRFPGNQRIIYNGSGLEDGTPSFEDENENIAYGEEEEPEYMKFVTDEQKQAIYDLRSYAAELQVDITDGEETVGDIVKFGFNPTEGKYVTISVSPEGDIKMSGHTVHNYSDFKDLVEFFQDMTED